MKKLALSLTILFASLTAQAQFFGGNPGDLFFDGKNYYLSDLYEGGVHLSPYIGNEVAQNIENADFSNLNSLQPPLALLKRKLTDIQKLRSFYGEYYVSVISMYKWELVKGELPLFPSDIIVPEGMTRIQVARRIRDRIQIVEKYWNLMDDQQKVALIVHETTFGLLQLEPMSGEGFHKVFLQPGKKARALVAKLFTADAFSKNDLADLDLLNVDWKHLNKEDKFEFRKMAFTVTVGNSARSKMVFQSDLYSDIRQPAVQKKFVKDACAQADMYRGTPGWLYIPLSDRNVYYKSFVSYCTPEGTQYQAQISVSFKDREIGPKFPTDYWPNTAACEETLLGVLSTHYSEEISHLVISDCDFF